MKIKHFEIFETTEDGKKMFGVRRIDGGFIMRFASWLYYTMDDAKDAVQNWLVVYPRPRKLTGKE